MPWSLEQVRSVVTCKTAGAEKFRLLLVVGKLQEAELQVCEHVTEDDVINYLKSKLSGASTGTGGSGDFITGAVTLCDTDDMNLFLASLDKHQEQFRNLPGQGIVQLDEGVKFPNTDLRQLYVRDSYVDLLEADAAYRALNPDLNLTYITGTPGIGKSCCLLVHMCRCLVQGATVIYHVRTQQQISEFYRLKLGEKALLANTEIAIRQDLANPQVCYFVDGGIPRTGMFRCSCWAYTSPRAMSRRAMKEIRRYCHTLTMPLFSLDELLAMRNVITIYQERMTEWEVQRYFWLAGGSAGVVLEYPTFRNYNLASIMKLLWSTVTELHGKLAEDMAMEIADCGFSSSCDTIQHLHVLTLEELQSSSPGAAEAATSLASAAPMQLSYLSTGQQQQQQQQPPSSSGSAAHVQQLQQFGSPAAARHLQPSAAADSPQDNRLRLFKHHRLQFASPYVAALVARHATISVRNTCAKFLLTASGDVDRRSLAGTQFERLVHATLPCVPDGGVPLKLKLLDTGQEFLLQLPASTPLVFDDLDSAVAVARADCSIYLMPPISNFPAIDCLLSRKVLLQTALGSEHEINSEGIKRVCRAVRQGTKEFAGAHEALEKMLQPLAPPADTSDERRRIKRTRASRLTSFTSADRPLLVFVTPDYQYDNWKGLQRFSDATPQNAPQQAVLKFPSVWAADEFQPKSKAKGRFALMFERVTKKLAAVKT